MLYSRDGTHFETGIALFKKKLIKKVLRKRGTFKNILNLNNAPFLGTDYKKLRIHFTEIAIFAHTSLLCKPSIYIYIVVSNRSIIMSS